MQQINGQAGIRIQKLLLHLQMQHLGRNYVGVFHANNLNNICPPRVNNLTNFSIEWNIFSGGLKRFLYKKCQVTFSQYNSYWKSTCVSNILQLYK